MVVFVAQDVMDVTSQDYTCEGGVGKNFGI